MSEKTKSEHEVWFTMRVRFDVDAGEDGYDHLVVALSEVHEIVERASEKGAVESAEVQIGDAKFPVSP